MSYNAIFRDFVARQLHVIRLTKRDGKAARQQETMLENDFP